MVQWTDGRKGLELVSASVPDQALSPGQSIDIELTVNNHSAGFFSDPDACGNASTGCEVNFSDMEGYCIKIVAKMNGQRYESNPTCVRITDVVPPSTNRVRTNIYAPEQEGEYTLEVWGVASATGNSSEAVRKDIVVSTDPTANPGDGDQGGNDNNNNDGGGNGLINFAKENPVLAGMGGVAAIVAVREGTNTVLSGE